VTGGRIEGDPANPSTQLLGGWLSSRCGTEIAIDAGGRVPGASGVDSVLLQLDQKEEVRIQADRKGGATISQPFRPDASVALPERPLGDLLSEELRRLDSDEPYREALEAATGVTGLADRSPVREHIWFDPAEKDSGAPGKRRTAKAGKDS
jgi:glucose-6-phosphate dehydrogenase assembly protein OpcA